MQSLLGVRPVSLRAAIEDCEGDNCTFGHNLRNLPYPACVGSCKGPSTMKKVIPATPKLSDVARLAGVGNATVSRVLNGHQHVSEETNRRVKQAISDLSYSPNRIAR